MIQIEPTIKRELLSIHDELTKKDELYSKKELQGYYDMFRQRFGPEKLSQLDGEELLETISPRAAINPSVIFRESQQS